MRSGDGVLRRAHPIVACYIGDYPEQLLVTGVKTGECPGCDIPCGELGSHGVGAAIKFRDLGNILDALSLVDGDPLGFTKACANVGIKPIYRPFWDDLPYCNIYRAMTPDILHQLYQGLIKHLIAWIKLAWCITSKTYLGIRSNFELPKLHSLRHYIYMIERFGTTDNYSTQYTERLHIDLTKDAYRATNHKDEYIQMTAWLERKEKILFHEKFVRWRLGDTDSENENKQPEQSPHDTSYIRQYKTAKHPSAKAVTLQTLETMYGATYLRAALARFTVKLTRPELSTRQQEDAAQDINLPRTLPTFHKIRFNS
ncbi:hypothetical protein PAXRUDRAFT_799979, partial [Paxillus rubicundulus Ve08.2h10]